MMYIYINLSRPARPVSAGQQGRYEQASKANMSKPARPRYVVYDMNMSRPARPTQSGQLGHATLFMRHEYEQASEANESRLARSHYDALPACYMRHD